MTDAEVFRMTRAIAAGDTDAFRQLYEAWFDPLYALARSLTGRDEAFCLDVVQDAMLRTARGLRTMRTANDLRRWLTRVVHTSALDTLRSERRRVRREEEAASARPESLEPFDTLCVSEERQWLSAQLARLPGRDRALLLERFARGKTLAAAGAAVGLSGNAAQGRIRRLLERLRHGAWEVFESDTR